MVRKVLALARRRCCCGLGPSSKSYYVLTVGYVVMLPGNLNHEPWGCSRILHTNRSTQALCLLLICITEEAISFRKSKWVLLNKLVNCQRAAHLLLTVTPLHLPIADKGGRNSPPWASAIRKTINTSASTIQSPTLPPEGEYPDIIAISAQEAGCIY